jgi:FkbM family methyltransferase
MPRVLIHLTHGLGDAVQLTSVFQHLRKYRPTWELYLQAQRGKHSVGRGYCLRVWHDQEPSPDHAAFDRVFRLDWWENYNGCGNCPNTKVTSCLREVFGIEPDPALLQYRLYPDDEALQVTASYFESIGARQDSAGRYNAVVIHYHGNTSTHKKNLHDNHAANLCETVLGAGFIPVILDWDRRSPLPDECRIFCPGVHGRDIWGAFGSGDAARITALIAQCSLFVGIDSGPQKCAGATDTPAIGVWTGHQPVQFMDLCANFIHLVPDHHQTIPPTHQRQVADYFANAYRWRTYDSNNLSPALNSLALHLLDRPGDHKPGLTRMAGLWVPEFKPEQSWVIIQDILLNDAYKTKLRPRRSGIETVVDIGANIGAFSCLWHERNPEARIVAVEVCPELIPALQENVGGYAEIIHAACTYEPEDMFLLSPFTEGGSSTGGARVVTRAEWEAETSTHYRKEPSALKTITLEEIMARCQWPRIDVPKLDCDGSEFSILEHCDLSRIGTIFLESHGAARFRELMARKFPAELRDIGHMSQGGEGGNFENWHLVNRRFSV